MYCPPSPRRCQPRSRYSSRCEFSHTCAALLSIHPRLLLPAPASLQATWPTCECSWPITPFHRLCRFIASPAHHSGPCNRLSCPFLPPPLSSAAITPLLSSYASRPSPPPPLSRSIATAPCGCRRRRQALSTPRRWRGSERLGLGCCDEGQGEVCSERGLRGWRAAIRCGMAC